MIEIKVVLVQKSVKSLILQKQIC